MFCCRQRLAGVLTLTRTCYPLTRSRAAGGKLAISIVVFSLNLRGVRDARATCFSIRARVLHRDADAGRTATPGIELSVGCQRSLGADGETPRVHPGHVGMFEDTVNLKGGAFMRRAGQPRHTRWRPRW